MTEQPDFLPKFHQISPEIIEPIRKGELRQGSMVPSKNDIFRDYQVSKTKAPKVHHELEQAGLVPGTGYWG